MPLLWSRTFWYPAARNKAWYFSHAYPNPLRVSSSSLCFSLPVFPKAAEINSVAMVLAWYTLESAIYSIVYFQLSCLIWPKASNANHSQFLICFSSKSHPLHLWEEHCRWYSGPIVSLTSTWGPMSFAKSVRCFDLGSSFSLDLIVFSWAAH